MAEREQPTSSGSPKGSLWTTPAAASSSRSRRPGGLVDTGVTAEKIRQAVEATEERARAFSGRVSDDLLKTSVG